MPEFIYNAHLYESEPESESCSLCGNEDSLMRRCSACAGKLCRACFSRDSRCDACTAAVADVKHQPEIVAPERFTMDEVMESAAAAAELDDSPSDRGDNIEEPAEIHDDDIDCDDAQPL